jgi:TRAP-type transport system small permease protein
MVVRTVVRLLEWLLIAMLGLMVILVFSNVVLRYGFNSGITFSEEVSRFLFVWVVFLGAVLMLRDNGHLGVHSFTKRLSFTGKRICKLVADVLSVGCCGVITWGGWNVVKLEMANIAPISGIALGMVFIAVLVGGIGMGILFVGSILRNLAGRMTEQEMVPSFEDVL